MTAIGAGYDLSVGTFSPEGRIFQVEYAQKSVENSGTALGIATPHGILLAIEKPLHSKLLKKQNINRRIETVDLHIGIVSAGFAIDALHVASRAREESSAHRDTFGEGMRVSALAERLALYVHAYTMYSSVRPFGVSTLVAGVDDNGPKLYLIEPDGSHYGYRAVAVGKGKQWARTELEKLNLNSLSKEDAIIVAAKILLSAITESSSGSASDKEVELEFSWVDLISKRHHIVDPETTLQAITKSKELLMAEMQYDVS